ncbi:MAG: hypothetical protein II135_01340, partial [Clostridia bacterium]|nr:hypothetical protein [Clostridia bacterium]
YDYWDERKLADEIVAIADKPALKDALSQNVKDEYHKTRALCDDENDVDISHEKALYMFIYRIQEEVHRFAITRMSNAKRKTLKTSSLEKIKGIGPAKARLLLGKLGSLSAVKNATKEQLTAVPGITDGIAEAIINHYKKDG